MELVFALLAERVETIDEWGLPTIYGAGFSEYHSSHYPAQLPPFSLALCLERQPYEALEEHLVEVHVQLAGSTQRCTMHGPVPPAPQQVHRNTPFTQGMAFDFPDVRVAGPGTCLFHIFLDDRLAKTLSLYLYEEAGTPALYPS